MGRHWAILRAGTAASAVVTPPRVLSVVATNSYPAGMRFDWTYEGDGAALADYRLRDMTGENDIATGQIELSEAALVYPHETFIEGNQYCLFIAAPGQSPEVDSGSTPYSS